MDKKRYLAKEEVSDKIFILLLSLFLFFFFFCCSKMSPIYPSNEWSDINIYQTIGRAIMSDKSLYVDIFDHKGPLIFIIYGLAHCTIGYKFLGLFILLYILWLAVLLHLFQSLSLSIPKTYSLIVCALTAYFSLNYSHTGGSPEEFILIANIFIISVLFHLSESITKRNEFRIKHLDAFFLGAFTSVILLLKFNLVSFYAFILLGIVLLYIQKKQYRGLYRFMVLYLLGILLIFVPVLIFLYGSNSLDATIDTYILLNKKMVSTSSFTELIRLGAKRILELFKYHLLGTILLAIGSLVYPILYIKPLSLKLGFFLATISTVVILYFVGVTHFYYTLPLYCLIPLGLFTIVDQLLKKYNLHCSIPLCSIFLGLIFILSVYQIDFWGLSFKQLTHKEDMPGVNYQFAKTIQKSDNPSLLVLSFGDAINIFTLCDIIPNIKYFSIVNIDYHTYPALRDDQTKVIDNKEVEYIVLNEGTGFFNEYKSLKENYHIVDTFEGYEEFQNVKIPKRTFLYKSN